LYYQEPCNIALVSERLKITAAATSQLIDTLVRSGLVNRTEYPENRRMKQLTLTSQGTAFIEEGNQRQYNRMEEILHNMNEEEREQVLDMFDILAKYT
jgi:DNA-binding MarR family transcriptional regulator